MGESIDIAKSFGINKGDVLVSANNEPEDKVRIEVVCLKETYPFFAAITKEKELFVKYLSDASQNLQLLLDNLLNWAKSQMNDHTLSKKSFNMGKVVQKNVQLFKENALRKNIARFLFVFLQHLSHQ